MSKLDELKTKYPKTFSGVIGHSFAHWGFECGEGWYAVLDRLGAKLEPTAHAKHMAQVKEKFGALRVYYDGPDADAAIRAAESESVNTCETCGQPAKLRISDNHWWFTMCDPCLVAFNQKNPLAERTFDADFCECGCGGLFEECLAEGKAKEPDEPKVE